MLKASHIHKYGIINVFAGYAKIDELFSNEANDPHMAADNEAGRMTNGQYYDVVVAICLNQVCETQIIVFKDKAGWSKYMEDGVLIFDEKEI